ncbi:MAG: hypothetical protein IJX72_00900, partial [Clostridia bacterium]|nr:hypothetical protein [Clostridia bacterium]
MNILFVGNSYTYYSDLPALFASLCRAGGQDVRVDSVTCGGRKLYENLNMFGTDLNPDDEYAQKIAELIDEVEYDVLFLQEQSCLPILNPEAFCAGVIGLSSVIGAWRTVLYATWGRADGSDTLAHYGWTRQSMTEGLHESYCQAAMYAHAEVSPVGLCFSEIVEKHPEINLYDPDKSHPSYTGSCVAALCHYKTVFGEMPRDLSALE